MIEFVNVIDLKGMSDGIWKRIGERILWPVFHPGRRAAAAEYPHLIELANDYFAGLFAELKRQTGGNCALNGTIVASTSNTYSGILTTLLDKSDWGATSCWQHQCKKDGWFSVDFKERLFVMSHRARRQSLSGRARTLSLFSFDGQSKNLSFFADHHFAVLDSSPSLRRPQKIPRRIWHRFRNGCCDTGANRGASPDS
jgi:hypothetical protein